MPAPEGGPPPAATPRDAAAVILYRLVTHHERGADSGDSGEVQVFWLRRERTLAFAGGFYAFAGGKRDRSDDVVPVDGAAGLDAALRVTAARELLEETGVLMALGPALAPGDVDAMRRALLDGTAEFGALLAKHGLTLRANDFRDAGRWVTPAFLPVRFDARFFLVEAPAQPEASVWPGELSAGEWISPDRALARWQQGSALLHPPLLHALETLAALGANGADTRALANLEQALRQPPMVADGIPQRIEFQQGMRLFPLRTPTLPPATHTNCYVVGRRDLLIIDPGSPEHAETDRLIAFVRELTAQGCTPRAVALTHHHADHVGGAARVMSELGLPLWCHARTADRLSLTTSRLLDEGDAIELDGMTLEVVHTPGHARGHLCFIDRASKAAIVGDMIAGVGTILIDPPEGEMAEYLRQLQRLQALGVQTLYPAHGPAIADGPAKIDEYLEHRARREAKLFRALPTGEMGITLSELALRAYDDVPAAMRQVAERSTLAVLEKLLNEGRVRCADDRYAAR